MSSPEQQPTTLTDETALAAPRRDFVKGAIAIGAGLTAISAPIIAGATVFLDPLLRSKDTPADGQATDAASAGKPGYVRVASLDSLAKGEPKLFKVFSDCTDAWNCFHDVPVGGVFLKLIGPQQVIAWNSRCPHLGCSVETTAGGEGFLCPCHMGKFGPDGERINEISPRDLDQLDVDIVGNDVWVQFKNYRQGISDKVEIS
ncbi:QcrA and Rieske domain-containing protein [Lacunimicrobium album]